MRYMVVERFTHGARPVYERAAELGRRLPPGLEYVDSWIDESLGRCFQLMETDDPGLFDAWIAEWSDLATFEIVPVIGSAEAATRALDAPVEEDEELREVDLTELERDVLWWGIRMWGGPAAMTDDIARAMWFADAKHFYAERERLRTAVADGSPLTPRDWHRALALTELGFISLVLGAEGDWSIVSDIDPETALKEIRRVQKKLARVRPWPEPHARTGHTG